MIIKFIFCKLFGWSINGKNNFIDKCVIIVAPHTHWLDFFLGITVRHILKIKIHFIGKNELFFFPLNFFLKYMGGIPVKRDSNSTLYPLYMATYGSTHVAYLLSPGPERAGLAVHLVSLAS